VFCYYYFDIETVPLEQYREELCAGLDPSKAKIITIQYQPLDTLTGRPRGNLTILKEWEFGSERAMIEQFRPMYVPDVWAFVAVGNNLSFECKFLKHKLQQYCNLSNLKLGQRPMIDVKPVLILRNRGRFKRCTECIGKIGQARNISRWYWSGNYNAILDYIQKETQDFIRAYMAMKREIPKIEF